MSSQTSGRMRRRVTIGGGILAAAIAFGIWLSQFLGTGLGIGSGTGIGKTNDDESKKTPSNVTPKTADARVVEVRVDAQGNYLLKQAAKDSTSYEPSDIKTIVELAKKAPGDETGVKVRLHRRVENSEDPFETLVTELKRAGLKDSEIHQPGIP